MAGVSLDGGATFRDAALDACCAKDGAAQQTVSSNNSQQASRRTGMGFINCFLRESRTSIAHQCMMLAAAARFSGKGR
ncbi:MAG: hypothetical protein ABSG69_11290, partial [Candidatus Acidiferrum sp.]